MPPEAGPTLPAMLHEVALRLRDAGPDDAAAIADLHARSWRASYRGSLSDAYLDGPIDAERRAFWTERLQRPPAGLVARVAERDGTGIAGFVCAFADHDARWGTLVDNLHVDPAIKRSGLGRGLLRALGERLADTAPGPVHLFVLTANASAAAFYARLGGETVEAMMKTEPDGSTLPVRRIAWPSAAALRAGAA